MPSDVNKHGANIRYKLKTLEQHEEAYYDRYTAERAQSSLLRRFEALAALIPAQIAEEHSVQSLLDGVRQDVDDQWHATDSLLSYIPREFRRPPAATPLAEKVFGTPELLERILLMVDTRTAFESYRVNTSFRKTIEGSVKLQRKLGLMPDLDSHISFKMNGFVEGSGMKFAMSASSHVQTEEGPEVEVQMTASGCCGSCIPRLPGPRLRSVQVTQPPIKDLEVETTCCSDGPFRYHRNGYPKIEMRNETGITIGELANKVAELRAAHRMCPHAPMAMHDDDGFVNVGVKFTGSLLLQEDDYSVVRDREAEEERARQMEVRDGIGERLGRYVRAKEAADQHGLPVPTLAEFEAERERRDRLMK